MNDPEGRASILIVDDKPEKLLALEVALSDLQQRTVRAASGREALRHLLNEEFAVILLDINMPDMDGFEVASLVRQRPSLQHIPIIFITSYGDETHMARGYSLGAVDYIHTPVIPEILRSKVSVFVELHHKTAQVHRQSENLRRRATQMQKLAAASMAINSAVAVEQMLQMVTNSARDIIGSDQCHALLTADPDAVNRRPRTASSFSDKYAKWRDQPSKIESAGSLVIAQAPSATRLNGRELHEHPDWEMLSEMKLPPLEGGLLAAPFTDRAGKNLGMILLTGCAKDSFTGDDEALLMQLAQITSIAVQNAVFARERETNRLKDEFLATLSHELRTPLNAIVGWTQLLRMGELPDDMAHGLDVIDRNVKAQSKLIEDLLDVSRIITGKMRLNLRDVMLSPIVRAAIDAIRPAAEAKHVELAVELAPNVRASADPDRLQQVAWNLLSNAVKFTPANGRVSISLERINSHVQIRVADTGQGIDPEFVRFVFDRFRQADSGTTRMHSGLGIGLNIVRHITELHGGAVEAYSAGLGKGSVFTVTLPLSAAPAGVSPQPAADPLAEAQASRPRHYEPLPKLKGIRVLLVDDEKDVRDLVSEILRRAEADVVAAASVREAFELMARSTPDILVSDLAMPEEDGYSLIRRLREFPAERGGRTPAIALTAYAREEDRLRTLSAGYQMHLSKPVEPPQLVSAIAYLTNRRRERDEDSESIALETGTA
jgi:signal transduction histidine kinase/DNA-binding response OmpR family regulator